ncbi:MFS transporter [Streptomyces glaucosporus]|uniref:MFS transporter n=1 Tax=Streptomyces glaucosporus TaxID=284044 RepID=A0ABP5VKJ4_9ACTN
MEPVEPDEPAAPAVPAAESGSAPGRGPAGGWEVARARRAVAVVFTVHGAVSGSFATRIPWIREHLDLGTGRLGLALVFATLGAAASMPLSARLAHRHGPRAALRVLVALCCAGLALPALAPGFGWLCGALFLFGAGLGITDVAMNAHAVQVEERMGRSVMSGLHGMWSVGALLGGGAGALAAHAALDARVHLALAAPVLAAAGVVAAGRTLDVRAGPAQEEPPHFALPRRGVLAIGVIGFLAVFAEGASMDWAGIHLRDSTGASPGLAATAYTAFACTMAAARLAGDAVVRRLGPVRTVRIGGLLAVAGGVLVATASGPAAGIAGFALIGVGIAVVVPLCFAAAGRSESAAPGRAIAGVATLAYASGLAAPAAVGWIAEFTSLSVSFGLVTVLLCGLVLGAGVLRTDPAGASGGRPGG